MVNSPAQDSSQESQMVVEKKPTCRPDSCWSWVVCVASVILVIIVSGIGYSFGLLLPPLMESFGASRQSTAWIGSLNLAFGYVLSPLGSLISDRFSHRVTAMVGALTGVIGFSLASLSPKLWMMYPTYGLMSGFGHRMIYNSCMVAIVDYFVRRLSLAVGIMTSATAIGMLVMTQVTQVLLDTIGWQGTLQGFAGFYLLCGLCSLVFVPVDRSENNKGGMAADEKAEEKENSSLFGNRPFLVLLSSFMVVNISFFVPAVHIIKHCEQELNISGDRASMLFIYLATTSFFSRHLFCKLGEFRHFNRFLMYQGGMTISGLCVICLPLATSYGSLVAIFIVLGLMEGSSMGQFSLLLLKCVKQRQFNQAWGYLNFFMGITISIGPPLAGLMADKLGSYTIPFYTSGAVLITGASIISLMPFVKQHADFEEEKEVQFYKEELLVTERITTL